MAGSNIDNSDHRLQPVTGQICVGSELDGYGKRLFDHVRVVNAAPGMAAVRHVTMLTLNTVCRIGTQPPLLIGVFEELAIQGKVVRLELMRAFTERRLLVSHAFGEAAMGQRRLGR